MLHVINAEWKLKWVKNTKLTINTGAVIDASIITQYAISHFITDTGCDTRFGSLCEIEKEHRVALIARKVIPIYIALSIALMIFHTMNSIAIFVLLSLTLIAATIVFSIPNAVQAKISFCASGTDIFQCFIKENDCETFSTNHPGTTCVRSKT